MLEEVFESFVLSRTKLALEGQVFRPLSSRRSFWSSDFDATKSSRAKLAVVFELFPSLEGDSAMLTLFGVLVYVQRKSISGGELLRAHPTCRLVHNALVINMIRTIVFATQFTSTPN